MSKIGALLAKDARAVSRDSFMLFMLLYGPLLALIGRLVVGEIAVPHLALYLAPAFPMLGALLVGNVLGFALVEERETRTFLLLRVAPLGERTLALYLCGAAGALALVSGTACALVFGVPVERPLLFAACLAVNALGAPFMMLLVGATASNKIEAMAIGKISGLLPSLPIVLFVIPAGLWWLLAWSPWVWLYLGMLHGVTPDALAAELALTAPALPDFVWPVAALALILPALPLLLRRYRREVQ